MTERVEQKPSWEEHIAPLGEFVSNEEKANAHLLNSGVAVWAIVGYSRASGGDLDQVAHDYDITRQEVDAAMAYYAENKELIDARLLLY